MHDDTSFTLLDLILACQNGCAETTNDQLLNMLNTEINKQHMMIASSVSILHVLLIERDKMLQQKMAK